MLQHLKGYQRSITLIKTGRLSKKTTQILIHKKKRKETEADTEDKVASLVGMMSKRN